jgi:hypothetical protein
MMLPPGTSSGSSTEHCSSCQEPYTDDEMVQCDKCEKWFHYACVDVDDDVENRTWSCSACLSPPEHRPSYQELLQLIEKHQQQEEKLKKDLGATQQELKEAKREIAEKKSTEGTEADNEELRKEKQELAALLKRVLENEKKLNLEDEKPANDERSSSGEKLATGERSVNGERPERTGERNRTSTDGEWTELATLMKQSHVEDLPAFSGSTKEWPLFLAVFNRTTSAASIDDVTNIGRLAKALIGEARELVLDQLTFGLSPSDVIATLKKRYGQQEMILKELSSELLDFPVIESLQDLNLRRFAVATKTYVAQLKALGLQEELNNNLMVSFLHEKLTQLPSMYQKWAQHKKVPGTPVVEAFAMFIMSQWESLPPLLTNRLETGGESAFLESRRSSVNLHSEGTRKSARRCFHCEGEHDTAYCFGFKALSAPDRWKVVKRQNLCFVCLKSRDHRSSACPEKKKCSEPGCERLHHRLLHLQESYERNLHSDSDPLSSRNDWKRLVKEAAWILREAGQNQGEKNEQEERNGLSEENIGPDRWTAAELQEAAKKILSEFG